MGGEILEHSQANEDLATEIKSDEEQKPVDRLGLILSTASARRHYDPHSLAPPIPHFPAPATASMATTVPDPIEGEHQGLKITAPINDGRLLMHDIKMKSCPFDGCKGGDKCLFLHPGEKGRRDPRRCSYSASRCPYYFNEGSCPMGDDCPFAHGLLERLLHPSLEDMLEYSVLWKLEDLMKYEVQRHGHHADAVERVAINLILALKRNGQIFGYEYARQVPDDMLFEKRFHEVGMGSYLSGMTKMGLAASKLDHSFYSGAIKYQALADARAVSKAIFDHDRFKTIIGGTYASKNMSTLKLFPSGVVAATAAAERVGLTSPLLCAAAASTTAGWIDEPELDASLDSAASVHVVVEDTELQGYQAFAEPWSIAVADGYSLDVLGVGYIETRRGSFSVPKVFKVRGLEMNLISVGQLDRDHGLFSGFHDGTCKVLKRDGDHIGGGFLQANNLYALTFLQVPEN